MKEKAVDQNISEEDPTFPVVTLGVFPSHRKRVQCHPRFAALSEDPADFAQRRGHIGIDQRHPRNHHIKVLASVGKCLGGPADEPDFISQRAAQLEGLEIDVQTVRHTIRINRDHGLAGAASNVQHLLG